MREIEFQQKVDAYLKGTLSESEIEELWTEVAKNPDLLNNLEIEVGLKELFSTKKTQGKPVKVRSLPRWAWHAAAAAVIATVALLQLFRLNTPTELHQFVIAEIETREFEIADGLRSNAESLNATADSLLNLGFQAIVSGDKNRAMEIFEQIIDKHEEEPYGSKAYVNKGIILYNQGDYSASVSAFKEATERVEGDNIVAEKAWWYLGNALVNMDELEEAYEAVYKTYQLNGVFRKPAFRLVVKLSQELGYSDFDEDFQIETLN